MIERTIVTSMHGRYLVAPAARGGPAPLLVGFHGYAELAEAQLERLQAVPGTDRCVIVSVQGLNRFYQRRTNDVIAGWMTRQDRELVIADNLAYVRAVVDRVVEEWPLSSQTFFAGFSQGVAMAFRAAAQSTRQVSGVIAAGGDVPPEIDRSGLARIGSVLLCRGRADQWYTSAIFQKDLERLRAAGGHVTDVEFDGGHEWSTPVLAAASRFLEERYA